MALLVKGSVGLFANHFKRHITKLCAKNGIADFEWQTYFYDSIIRDEEEYKTLLLTSIQML